MSEVILEDISKIASGIYLEGLAVDHRSGKAWYSDVIAGGIHSAPDDGQSPVLNPGRMWTGGVIINSDGSVLSSGEGGVMWNNPATGASGWLINELEGKPVNGINEMAPDGEGGLFFGTNDIEKVILGETTRPTEIYRLTRDYKLIKLAEGIGFTNGMMHDMKRRRLYCNDTFNCTWVFDITEDFGLVNKQKFLDKDDVDGMALDSEGNVWITGFRSSRITRVTPEGKELSPVETPAGSITQVRFGGADARDLYINSVPSDGGDSLKKGEPLTAKNSFLFRARSPVAGQLIEAVDFVLS